MFKKSQVLLVVAASAWALAAATAHADYVGVSTGISRTPPSDGYPGSGSNSFGASGSYDLNARWNFGLSLGLFRPKPADDSSADVFTGKTKDGNTFSAGLGATWIPGMGWNAAEHWSFDFGFGFSPKSTDLSSTTVSMETATAKGSTTEDYAALLKSSSTSQDLTLGINYDTAGDSNLEWSFSLGLWPSRLASTQTIEELVSPKGVVQKKDDLLAMCQKPNLPKIQAQACKRILPLLKAQAASIVTFPVVLSATANIAGKSSVTLGGTYYLYSDDPNNVGYFTLAAQGKQSKQGQQGGAHASFGSGIAVAPYVFSANLTAGHKLGPVRLSAGGGYSKYMNDAGHNTSASFKAVWKITDNWRVNIGYGRQWDTDSESLVTPSWSLAGGLRYTFSEAEEDDEAADATAPAEADKADDKKADPAPDAPKADDKPTDPKPETPASETPKA